MNELKVRSFLEECNVGVVQPALKRYLDVDCYQRYLRHVGLAVAESEELRRQFGIGLIDGHALEEISLGPDVVWGMSMCDTFGNQAEFMSALLYFIDNYGVEAKEAVVGQLSFIKEQLLIQRHILDTILLWSAPKTQLLSASQIEDMTKHYRDVVTRYNNTLRKILTA